MNKIWPPPSPEGATDNSGICQWPLRGRGRGHILFIIDFLNLNLGAYLIFWAKNTVENVSGPFGARGGAYEIGEN